MTRYAHVSHQVVAVLILVLGLLWGFGCKGTTQSGTKYVLTPTRELQSHLNADLATVHNKAVAVLRDEYGYTIKKEAKDALEGIVEATTARDKKVTVQTFKKSDDVTTIEVWVGPLGDKEDAAAILSSIEKAVGPADQKASAAENK